MTIIIDEQQEFHSYLHIILKSILNEIRELNWLCNNVGISFDYLPFQETTASLKLMEANFDYPRSCDLTGSEFYEILTKQQNQYIWGVFSAFRGLVPEIPIEKQPYADGNEEIWKKPEVFQTEDAEMEIICFDSTYTILKFKDESLAKRIMLEFPGSKILTPSYPA